MTEKSKISKVEEQSNLLRDNLDRMDKVIIDLTVTTESACGPGPCEYDAAGIINQTGQLVTSPLATSLQGFNVRILSFIQRITDINERLEL